MASNPGMWHASHTIDEGLREREGLRPLGATWGTPWSGVSAVSWGAVLAGLVIAAVVYLVLSVLGTAIGASAVRPQQADPFAGLGAGALIWLVAVTAIAVAAGSYVAGQLAQRRGLMHGLLHWASFTLLSFYVLASAAGGVLGSVLDAAGQGVAAVGRGVVDAAPQALGASDAGDLRRAFDELLAQTGKPELAPDRVNRKLDAAGDDAQRTLSTAGTDPRTSDAQLDALWQRIAASAKDSLDAADREALVNVVAARTGRSHAEAEQIVDRYQQTYRGLVTQYRQLRDSAASKAAAIGGDAAKQVSSAAWLTLAMLLIGAALAAGCGALGERSARQV